VYLNGGGFVFERGLRGSEARHGNAEWRAVHVGQPELVAELHRLGVVISFTVVRAIWLTQNLVVNWQADDIARGSVFGGSLIHRLASAASHWRDLSPGRRRSVATKLFEPGMNRGALKKANPYPFLTSPEPGQR